MMIWAICLLLCACQGQNEVNQDNYQQDEMMPTISLIDPSDESKNEGVGVDESKISVSDEVINENVIVNQNNDKKDNKKTLENLIMTATKPLGNTMYIWGGGWNKEDTGAGIEALTLGVSPRWKEFADMQDSSYNYKNYDYQIHDGLDCSGFIGWVIYNIMEDESFTGDEAGYVEAGYVMSSTNMADNFADRGWGEVSDNASCSLYYPGDIVSMKGHVWMSLGTCKDGSVLMVHASPPGVKISGTPLEDGSESQAIKLAQKIMKECYSKWYERFPDCSVKGKYLTEGRVFHWNSEALKDDDNLMNMNAEEIADYIIDKVNTQN